ncbi:hypothetical protein NSTC731_01422 [Nostoc sp. DSM 114167]|jgi:hypothetical protein
MKQDAPALTNPNPMYTNLSEKEEEKVNGGGVEVGNPSGKAKSRSLILTR